MTSSAPLRRGGAVAFTDGARCVTNARVMRRALLYARDVGALVMNQCEDPDLVGDGVMNEGEFAARLGLLGIPREAETIGLERDVRLARLAGARLHAPLISCPDSVEIALRAKEPGIALTRGPGAKRAEFQRNDISSAYRTAQFSRPGPRRPQPMR